MCGPQARCSVRCFYVFWVYGYVWVSIQYACIGLHGAHFVTASVKPICIISAGCEMWLHSCIARLCWVCFQWSHRVNSAHVNPWLLGLSDGTKARGLSREPVAVPVRGGASGVTLTSTKTTLISNTCLCLPRPSLVSPWKHCALFPVVVETRCVHKRQTLLCSGSSL